MPTRTGAFALLLAGATLGCGGSDHPADADLPGRDGDVVAPPEIPWLEVGVPPIGIAPCPEGWREVAEESGLATCDPYPEGGALECPAGEAHFPGEPGCTPVGSPCPAGDYSETLPADRRVIYVRPGASGGDGMSPTTPYGSFTDFSLGGLPTGTVIALSRGTHTGPVRLTRGIVLRGACAAATVVSASEPTASEGVVTVLDRGELVDLTVADSPRNGVWVSGPDAEATVEGVMVVRTAAAGLTVFEGSRLTAHTMVVRETRGRTTDLAFGRGLNVQLGAVVEVSRAIFDANRDVGVMVAQAGTSATLSDVVVRNTESQTSDGTGGRGLDVELGATVALSCALVDANRDLGIFVGHAPTALTASDVIVRATEGQALDGGRGRGLSLVHGARADISRALIEANREIGVFADDTDTVVTLSDVIVRGTLRGARDDVHGRGLNVQNGATAEGNRVLLDANREVGLFAAGAGATATLTDTLVRDSRARACAETTCASEPFGQGAVSTYEASVSMTRFVIDRSHLCGIHLAHDGEADLMHGEVRAAAIGACVQVDGYDASRLTRSVRFIDNATNLQTTSLPVPEPATAIPDPP